LIRDLISSVDSSTRKVKRRLEGQLEIYREIKELDFSRAWFAEKVELSDLSCSEGQFDRGTSVHGRGYIVER